MKLCFCLPHLEKGFSWIMNYGFSCSVMCIGRIWAGHNILRFDCARIKEAFAQINKPAPEPKGTIDSLALLTQRFGRRAGDMKVK